MITDSPPLKGKGPNKVDCPICKTPFLVQNYRLKKFREGQIQHPTCSYKCAWALLKQNGYKNPTKTSNCAIDKARDLYENTDWPIKTIANAVGRERTCIFNWAKIYKWIKFPRTFAVRTVYRKLATIKMGRPLLRFEQVHHIDGDVTHNTLENIFVYPNAADHSAAHKSLEFCGLALMKRGLIVFDEQTGKYKLKENT